MKAENDNLKISRERRLQLAEVCAASNATTLDLFRQIIENARADGLVDHHIPGVRFQRLSDGIAISFDDGPYHGFGTAAAKSLADTIRTFVNRTNSAKKFADTDADFLICRRGPAIAICIPMGLDPVKVWNDDLASEFADLIDRELTK